MVHSAETGDGVTTDERMARINAYAAGHAAIMAAVTGLDEGGLDRAEAGEWSVRQILHHLADLEVVRGARLRRMLSQEEPLIQSVDELRMAERLHYERPAEVSLALLDASVRSNLELLALMSEPDWAISAVHTVFGAFSMDDWLERAANHLSEHAAQIRRTLGGAGTTA